MADQTPQKWAEAFTNDLVLDGERLPFDRVVQRHRTALAGQRAKGLTWKNLANLLRRAGATREDGKAYTADHLRVAFGRTDRAAGSTSVNQPVSPTSIGRGYSQPNGNTRQLAKAPTPPPFTVEAPSLESGKDVSEDELDLAINRINKLKKIGQ